MKMNNAWWVLTTLGLSLGLAINGAGCGSDPATGTTGGSGGTGGTGGTGGVGGVGGTGTGGTGNVDQGEWLGLPCTTDSECAPGTCVVAGADDPVFGGGPQNGYCSKTCAKSGDCPGVGSICFKGANGSAAEGRCVASCEVGNPERVPQRPARSLQVPGS